MIVSTSIKALTFCDSSHFQGACLLAILKKVNKKKNELVTNR